MKKRSLIIMMSFLCCFCTEATKKKDNKQHKSKSLATEKPVYHKKTNPFISSDELLYNYMMFNHFKTEEDKITFLNKVVQHDNYLGVVGTSLIDLANDRQSEPYPIDCFQYNFNLILWWYANIVRIEKFNRIEEGLIRVDTSNFTNDTPYYYQIKEAYDLEIFIPLLISKMRNRNPKFIKRIFRDWKSALFEVIDKETAQSMCLSELCTTLIDYYKTIHKKGYKNIFNAYLSIVPIDNGHGLFIEYHYGKQSSQDKMLLPNFDDLYPYTFWARRYGEGNMKVIYEILIELKQKYSM